jgi:GNAT superfamily N-acetyltransferase
MTEIVDFEHESASCKVVLWEDGTASLSDVYAKTRRQGHATELLNTVMRWVDDRGLILKTVAQAHGTDPKLSSTQLVEFYKKFGFVPLTDATDFIYMERQPN